MSEQLIILSKNDLRELINETVSGVIKLFKTTPQDKKESTPKYLTRNEVMALLNITAPTLQHHTVSGRLKAHYIGRRVLYVADEVYSSIDTMKAIIIPRRKKLLVK